jgi:hypothetical protein
MSASEMKRGKRREERTSKKRAEGKEAGRENEGTHHGQILRTTQLRMLITTESRRLAGVDG